jgi:predicted negative regulator of RcsB-dependent stress response
MSGNRQASDAIAALDAAQQQLKAAATSTLEEHLRAVAQRRVDEELAAVRASGVWPGEASDAYEVIVRRTPPV